MYKAKAFACRKEKKPFGSLFMSLPEMSRVVLLILQGVPVLEDGRLVGVSVWGVHGPGLVSFVEESRSLDCVASVFQLPPSNASPSGWMTSWHSGSSWDVKMGSASVLCLTEFRLCARIRVQLVERKLSASNQKRTKWSMLHSSVKCIKCGIAMLSLRMWSTVLDSLARASWGW